VSTCIFCGNPAGFLHTKHTDCLKRHENGKNVIKNLILKIPNSSNLIQEIATEIKLIAENSFISEHERNDLSANAWSEAVDHSLHDGVLSEQTEKRLVDFKRSARAPAVRFGSNRSLAPSSQISCH
jgi:hypothetical protein